MGVVAGDGHVKRVDDSDGWLAATEDSGRAGEGVVLLRMAWFGGKLLIGERMGEFGKGETGGWASLYNE